jgi:hypothetical protein
MFRGSPNNKGVGLKISVTAAIIDGGKTQHLPTSLGFSDHAITARS